MGSFSTPLSGLIAAQDQLQTVSNNLANQNTDGYKDQNLTFADIFAQAGAMNGAGDPIQTGSGVSVSASVSDESEGNLNSTNISSNMAISGNGYFVTQSASGQVNYTRTGDFETNKAGDIVDPNGNVVLGYPVVNGAVNTTGALGPINVSLGSAIAGTPSTQISVTANLNSDTATNGTAPSSSLPVYDSLGSAIEVSISYTKTGTNTWDYTVTVPSSLITGGTGATTTVGSGTLNFGSNGSLQSVSNVVPISIPTLADGAASPLTLSGPFGSTGAYTITQNSNPSGSSATSTDGYPGGTLSSYAVQPDGTVEGTYSSGTTLPLGQVVLANFANVQGLSATGKNNFEPTAASGSAVIGVAGTGGRGTIVGGEVEQSNVNIAAEFAKLIVAQQAYSANAKSITTFNQVSQATLQMIQ